MYMKIIHENYKIIIMIIIGTIIINFKIELFISTIYNPSKCQYKYVSYYI